MLCLQISDLLHAMQATVAQVLLIDAKEHVKALTHRVQPNLQLFRPLIMLK
jgi:hypothetical protein